jgi:hypothetical protein
MSRGQKIALALTLGAAAVLGVIGIWLFSILNDPDVSLLFPEEDAEWIRIGKDEGPNTYGAQDFMAAYRVQFEVGDVPQEAVLYFRVFRFAAVFLDGVQIAQTPTDFDTWKQRYSIDLAPLLTEGSHELMLSSINRTGPPAVLAHCEALNIHTSTDWEGRTQESTQWSRVSPVSSTQPNDIGHSFDPVSKAFFRTLPFLVPIFCMGVVLALIPWNRVRARGYWSDQIASASGLRWLLISVWAILAVNNITKIPYGVGFDIEGHMQYIQFLVRRHSIPLAMDGWQLFQSPLFYLISAPLHLLLGTVLDPIRAAEALRVVPLLCGALNVQISYLVLREVYPKRDDLQALGTLVVGSLPINLYMSQYLGNESMAGLFTALIVLAAVRLWSRYDAGGHPARYCCIGLALGLSMLTKVTALLMCFPLSLLFLYVAYTHHKRLVHAIRHAAMAHVLTFGVAFVVCGWYYISNWVRMGVPFMGGWDEARGYIWWQEPGFRTVEQFVQFGEALRYPIYSSVQGFWDGYYSTLWLDGYNSSTIVFDWFQLWNYDLMLTTAWLALVPACGLVAGIAVTVYRVASPEAVARLFCLACLAIYFAAMVQITIRISGFSTVKASYSLGLLSCYAVLIVAGLAPLLRYRLSGAILWGAMITWSVISIATHFVL